MKIKKLFRKLTRPEKGTNRSKFQVGEEVYDTLTKEVGRVDDILYPHRLTKSNTIKYKISWTRRTNHGTPRLVAEIVSESEHLQSRN